MLSGAWDRTDEPQPTLQERVRNAAAFAVWFVLGNRAAKRLAGRD